MIWANFLHIYQPPNQLPDILEMIVNQSYRKLVKGLKEIPQAKITFNINAGLTQQLIANNYQDVIGDLKNLAEKGQIEFTESAAYHAFLPLLPEEEIERQIKLNNEINRKYFGKVYQPKGVFVPEMAYHPKIAKIIAQLGYQWLIADEISFNGKVEEVNYNQVYLIKNLKLKIFFRERKYSNLIMGAVIRSAKSLLEVMGEQIKENRYLLTAMDGETFGHHRPGLDKLLFEILKSKKFKKVLISEIPNFFPIGEEISPLPANWASTEKEIEEGTPYLYWQDPSNIIHQWQWEFANFDIQKVSSLNRERKDYQIVREKLDKALSSDQYWWAGAKPWWSLEMIEAGAFRLLEVIKSIEDISKEDLSKAKDYYQKIVLKAIEWQRTGYIRKFIEEQMKWIKIPFKERAKPGEYPAVLAIMEREMKKSAKRQEFEKAILWRDAITKLKEGTDIYDVIHVVDLLRAQVNWKELEELVEKYKKEYKKIKSGLPG